MAWGLRALLALDIATAAIAAWLLHRAGAAPLVAVGAPMGALLARDFALVCIVWALSRHYACPLPAGATLGLMGAARAILAEFLATEALARLWMPFDGLTSGPDRLPREARRGPPVLLIHGYLCNRGYWFWIRRRLERAGYVVGTLTLEPVFSDIDAYADSVRTRIEALAAATGAARVVVVGHSMGGLASRAYLRRFGANRVARLITLGTPHAGTRLARLGFGPNARQMRTGSEWLHILAGQPCPAPATAVWSTHDTIVAPQDSGRLAGAREIVLVGLGHLAMAISPRILAILIDEMERLDSGRQAEPLPAPARDA